MEIGEKQKVKQVWLKIGEKMMTQEGYAILDFAGLLVSSLCSLFFDTALPVLVFVGFQVVVIQHALTMK